MHNDYCPYVAPKAPESAEIIIQLLQTITPSEVYIHLHQTTYYYNRKFTKGEMIIMNSFL